MNYFCTESVNIDFSTPRHCKIEDSPLVWGSSFLESFRLEIVENGHLRQPLWPAASWKYPEGHGKQTSVEPPSEDKPVSET